VKKWAILRDRLVEIAKVMRRFPWMVEVVRQSQVSIFHPYMVTLILLTALLMLAGVAPAASANLARSPSCKTEI
jgi:hypothetical protein